jgi:lipopolysaccharide/colanic/teichoic acid biosynthesis glycosyltransferase
MNAATHEPARRSMAHRIDETLKVVLDYVLAALGILVLSPAFIALAILVKRDSPGPVIYRRRVVGRGGRLFDAFKFRTMAADADAQLAQHPEWAIENRGGRKLQDDPRLTRFGRRLRKTSLNELPQLFNVLLGQMSLVGPRMITLAELEGHDEWREAYIRVRPGITGPWQVSGREDLPLEERIRLDVRYVERRNILMDIGLIFRTIPAVLRGKGAY